MQESVPDQKSTFSQLVDFYGRVNELKFVERWAGIPGIRSEDSASHTWRMSLMAIHLAKYMGKDFDLAHALKIIIAHDIPEVDAGDTTFDKVETGQVLKSDKQKKESEAMRSISSLLGVVDRDEMIALHKEYDACETLEAKFAKVIDKAEAALHSLYEIGPSALKRAPNGPIPAITHLNSACGLIPQLDPFLRHIKALQKEACQRYNIEWTKECNGPEGWA